MSQIIYDQESNCHSVSAVGWVCHLPVKFVVVVTESPGNKQQKQKKDNKLKKNRAKWLISRLGKFALNKAVVVVVTEAVFQGLRLDSMDMITA